MSGDNLLGDFIKARRGRIQAYLPGYGRRRVPGLRREELAGLAGVSVAYLTRLEQGVDRNPSAQVLDALAAALHLSPDEAAHLHTLAATPRPPGGNGAASAEIRRLVETWGRTPAYVRDRRFDVLAANKTAMALSPMYTPGQNLVRGIFLDPAARELFPDWAVIAAQTVAALRAEGDQRDPDTAALITALSGEESFRRLWADHDVRPVRDELKRFDHPVVGELALRRQALSIAGAEGQVIIVYQAEPLSSSADALARLL